MNYEKRIAAEYGEVCAPEPAESLTDTAKQVRILTSDVLSMTRRIREHLFGIHEAECRKEAEPGCFREELTAAKCELLTTGEELAMIMQLLGV